MRRSVLRARALLKRGACAEAWCVGLLAAPPDAELLLLDYHGTGVSLHEHPLLRVSSASHAEQRDALTSQEVSKTPHVRRVRVLGLVIGRQRRNPSTAA